MDITIYQVGKRWFKCLGNVKNPLVSVEATYSKGFTRTYNSIKSKEAGYDVYDWTPAIIWTLTGKGANKYRKEIIQELDKEVTP